MVNMSDLWDSNELALLTVTLPADLRVVVSEKVGLLRQPSTSNPFAAWRFSQFAIASSVSWRSVLFLITSMMGNPMAEISIKKMKTENHVGGGKTALMVANCGVYMDASQRGDAGSLQLLASGCVRGVVVLPSKAAADSLGPPTVNVTDTATLPEQVGRVYPRPEELPHNREPPFPAFGAMPTDFHFGALHSVVEDTVAGMELLRPKEDEKCKHDLNKV
jgi:hypothetical protein